MSIDFNCTSCGTYLQASDHLVGRTLKCYKCANLFTVPAASTIARPGAAPAAPPPMAPAPMAAPPPMAPAAAPLGADFELPPDFAVEEPLQPLAEEPVVDLEAAEDILMLEEEPAAAAPGQAVDEFDAGDILLLEEEPPPKKKK